MLALTAVPVSVWREATGGPVLHGFDRNLLSINEQNYRAANVGVIQVSPTAIHISAVPDSLPSVHLVTTSADRFGASMNVRVDEASAGTTPLSLGVWSPRSNAGFFLVFGPAPDYAISTESVVSGISGQTLVGGTVDRVVQGRYLPGETYDLDVSLRKDAGEIVFDLSGGSLQSPIKVTATRASLPGLLTEVKLTLTASAASSSGRSSATLQDYSLSLPSDTEGAIKVDDPHATALLVALAVLGASLLAVAVGRRAVTEIRPWPRPRPRLSRLVRGFSRKGLLAGGGAVLAIAIANAVLFKLGVSPFDMADQETWSYIAAAYGPAQVYVLAPFVSVAQAWNGVPYSEAVFPYQPVMVYLFELFGWIARPFDAFQIDFLIKAVNVAAGLVDGLLIIGILRRLRTEWRWSVIAAALFVLNPAVWFSTSIWGANHVLSIFFVLLAILLAEYDHPIGAWLALGVGSMTRPQMLVFGLIVGVMFLRRFGLWRNAHAMAWSVIVIFLLLVPFTSQISPSLPVDQIVDTFRVQALGANEKALTTVSLDAYSFWPLVTLFQAGQSGLNRMFYPSDSPLIGGITYHQAGLALALIAALGAVCTLIARGRSFLLDGGYLPVVAFGMAGFLMFTTGLAATHFILALPFILLSRRWMSSTAYYSVVAGWTVTTLTAMYGILAVDLANADYLHAALFGQAAQLHSLSQAVANLYTWDRFITVGVVMNMAALIALMVAAVRSHLGWQAALADSKPAPPPVLGERSPKAML
jgi:hypothetical protein